MHIFYAVVHFMPVDNTFDVIQGGAKRTHVFQIIVTLFIFNIKKLFQHQKTCNKCSFDYLHWLFNYGKLYRKDGVVSRFGHVPWPPRSPDLSACDFFLWGYLKSKVYVRKPRTVDDLKVSIREEIATVPKEMLVNVMQNFEESLRTCVRQEGRHLSDIIFRNWVIKFLHHPLFVLWRSSFMYYMN